VPKGRPAGRSTDRVFPGLCRARLVGRISYRLHLSEQSLAVGKRSHALERWLRRSSQVQINGAPLS